MNIGSLIVKKYHVNASCYYYGKLGVGCMETLHRLLKYFLQIKNYSKKNKVY